MNEFRESFWCRLDLILQNYPLTCDGCRKLFTVEYTYHFKGGCGGGLVDLRHNLLNKDWAHI